MVHKVIEVPGYDPDLEAAMKEYVPKYRAWTDKERDTLRRYYGKVNLKTLCEKLGRSDASINTQASALGLRRDTTSP